MTAVPRVLALLLLLPAAALAQTTSSSGLAGHNGNAPVDVAAEHGSLASRDDKAVLYGNVHVTQDTMTLDAARVIITYTNDQGTQIRRIDASGGVLLTSPTETARGQFAIYDLDRKVVTMLGGVVLNRSGNVIHSERLVYDMNTGRANVDSNPQSGGRVTGRFTVPQHDVPKPPAAATPAAPATTPPK